MTRFPWVLLALLLGLPLSVPMAALGDQEACQANDFTLGVLRGITTPLLDKTCAGIVTPANPQNLTYRDFDFFESGLLMIFNSTPGSEATSTGARSYFLFPRKHKPAVSPTGDGKIAVLAPSGTTFIFSPQTGLLESASNLEFKLDPRINMQNGGGVEITRTSGVILDTGWKVGDVAYANRKGKSMFKDQAGKTCVVTNAEVFNYSNDEGARFAFEKDADLVRFLAARCPSLDLSSLRD